MEKERESEREERIDVGDEKNMEQCDKNWTGWISD